MLPYRHLTGRILAIVAALSVATTARAAATTASREATGTTTVAYQEAGQLPARIMSFTAEPLTIKPGESATLKWAVENPRTTTIEPTVGRAVPFGELKVTPAATTTYTLTVTGVNGTLTRPLPSLSPAPQR